jgi:sugar phosphate isomerase/epimerase
MVHLKDLRIFPDSAGDPTAWWPTAPLGHGDFDVPAIVAALARRGFDGTLFVEMSAMHPNWPDEDRAVEESVAFLERLLANDGGRARA